MSEPLKAFVYGKDLAAELQTSALRGTITVTPNEDLALSWLCSDGCGVAEVEITFVRWLKEPAMFKKARADS